MLSISKHLLISFREWLHSYSSRIVGKRRDFYGFSSLSESGFIPTWYLWTFRVGMGPKVLISFREWLHSYSLRLDLKWRPGGSSSHLFQRVASFLHSNYLPSALWLLSEFSSLSESGFIPTDRLGLVFDQAIKGVFSSLSESGFIPTIQQAIWEKKRFKGFSSLSESGFIPTRRSQRYIKRRWRRCSHLFQKVASFLPEGTATLREHFSNSFHLFQRVASFLLIVWG